MTLNNVELFDFKASEQFLRLLDPETKDFTFQTFDDDQDRASPQLARILNGSLDEHYATLCQLSRKGAGVFVTVNGTDGTGRRLNNITNVRSLWREDDTGTQIPLPIPAQIKVESSPGKYHEYILVNGLTPDLHGLIQKSLADDYGSDKNATDLSRVLRLPGFPHQKKSSKKGLTGKPFMVKVVESDEEVGPYLAEQVLAAMGLDSAHNSEAAQNNEISLAKCDYVLTNDQINDIRAALSFLDADDRSEWITTGQNLKSHGDEGFNLWDDWAQTSEKYDSDDATKKWTGFAGDRSDYRSIFSRAMAKGWINPKKKTPLSMLAKKIYTRMSLVTGEDVEQLQRSGILNLCVIETMISAVLWQPLKARFYLIGQSNNQLISAEKDINAFLVDNFGYPYNYEAMTCFLDNMIQAEMLSRRNLSYEAQVKLRKRVSDTPFDLIVDHLKQNNQRPKVELMTDMFADVARVDLSRSDKAVFQYIHVPVPHTQIECSDEQMRVIFDDYTEHFPMLDEIIEFIVAARFAADRKTANLWINCPSDWGKGFFLSILKDSGWVVEMSEKELDCLLSGAPVGKSAHDFVNHLALVFDEVKRVTGNFKLLQSSIPCTPKYEMTIQVPIYAKLFLSAEQIPSLAGEHGVEQQFANRFNLLRCEGNLTQREIFREVGSGMYHRVCKHFVSQKINVQVNWYRELGQIVAEKKAQEFLNLFHDKYGISKAYSLLDESLNSIANEIAYLMIQIADDPVSLRTVDYPVELTSKIRRNLIETDDGRWVIRSPISIINTYIQYMVDASSQKMMAYKTASIAECIGQTKPHRIDVKGVNQVVKGIDITETDIYGDYLLMT